MFHIRYWLHTTRHFPNPNSGAAVRSGGLYWLGISCIMLSGSLSAFAQEADSVDISSSIWMDSITITAAKKDFDVAEFIVMVREDKSFEQAFSNLRRISYTADNHIRMEGKRGKRPAEHRSRSRQTSDGTCRSMVFMDKDVKGDYYRRKGKPRYYTAQMYERLFFTRGEQCGDSGKAPKKRGVERYVSELKRMIFQPGEEVDVPLIGRKAAIFTKDMVGNYDFSITSAVHVDGTDCYVFTAKIKGEYENRGKKAVVRFLETYFSKTDFQIMARNYTMRYKSPLFDLDIKMHIELQKWNDMYVPSFLQYDGWFNVPTKKPERGWFEARFYDFGF